MDLLANTTKCGGLIFMTLKEFINCNPMESISIYAYNSQVNEWENNEKILNAIITDIQNVNGEICIDIDI